MIDVRAVALGIGGPGSKYVARSESGEGNRSCTTSNFSRSNRAAVASSIQSLLYPPATQTPCTAPWSNSGRKSSKVVSRWAKWAMIASTPRRFGTFFGADREAAGKSLVLAHRRHGPQDQQRLGIDAADQLAEQIRLFDRQVAAKSRPPNGRPCGGLCSSASERRPTYRQTPGADVREHGVIADACGAVCRTRSCARIRAAADRERADNRSGRNCRSTTCSQTGSPAA